MRTPCSNDVPAEYIVLKYFVLFGEQTLLTFLSNINKSLFLTETQCILGEVEYEF